MIVSKANIIPAISFSHRRMTNPNDFPVIEVLSGYTEDSWSSIP